MKALLAIVLAVLPLCGMAKGEGVGLWMEGQVSEVREEGKTIRLVLTGRFWFEQYHGQGLSLVEVKDLRGGPATIPVAITQDGQFFAMVENWRGGALRERSDLLRILRAASGTGRVVKFELIKANLKFEPEGRFAVESGEVIRATDHALH